MRVCASAGARVCMCANVCLRRFAWPPAALPSHRPSATFLIAKMRLAPQCLCICMYACACVCVAFVRARVHAQCASVGRPTKTLLANVTWSIRLHPTGAGYSMLHWMARSCCVRASRRRGSSNFWTSSKYLSMRISDNGPTEQINSINFKFIPILIQPTGKA